MTFPATSPVIRRPRRRKLPVVDLPQAEHRAGRADLIVEANLPVPHPKTVLLVEQRGHDKTAAKKAVARC